MIQEILKEWEELIKETWLYQYGFTDCDHKGIKLLKEHLEKSLNRVEKSKTIQCSGCREEIESALCRYCSED